MKSQKSKVEHVSFSRKYSIMQNPFVLRCERPYGKFTQEDIDLFNEMYAYYMHEAFDEVT